MGRVFADVSRPLQVCPSRSLSLDEALRVLLAQMRYSFIQRAL